MTFINIYLIISSIDKLILRPIDAYYINILATIVGQNTTLFYWLHDYWEESPDPRTKGYPLVDISVAMMVFGIQLGYLLSVTVYIPMYMRNRKPYDLKNAIIAYDFLLVFNLFLLIKSK